MYSVSLPYLILTALCVPSDPTSARTHTAPALHFSDVYPSRGHILSFMYVPYFITIITRVVQYNMHVGLVFGRNNIFDRSRHHLTCTRCFMTRYVFPKTLRHRERYLCTIVLTLWLESVYVHFYYTVTVRLLL